jgi:hypothetical protein
VNVETEPASERNAPDPIEAMGALSICLRHLACGWSLHPAERAACLSLLQSRIPGVLAADLAAIMKVLASTRRFTARQRHQASELSVRLAEVGASRRG